jgi:hypothetical protein
MNRGATTGNDAGACRTIATGDEGLGAANWTYLIKSDGKIFAPWLTYFDITN